MTDKQLKKLSKKIDPATITRIITTEMDDQFIAVTDDNLAKIYLEVLSELPDVAGKAIETLLEVHLLRQKW